MKHFICTFVLLSILSLCETTSEQIQVHFVPHSHLDAGWIMKYDEYYEERVIKIFTTVFAFLFENPNIKYSVGDILYFKRYYDQQTDKDKEMIRGLVERGQLEILHGGFVSNDEACPNYSVMF